MSYHKQKRKEEENYLKYSKATNNWSAKPIKENKDQSVFKKLVSRMNEVVANGEQLRMLKILPKTTASVEKPCKSTVTSYKVTF